MKSVRLFLLFSILALLGFDPGWSFAVTPRSFRDPRLERANHQRPSRSTPSPGDEFWWDGFGLPVTDGTVNAAIEYQGALVIAGRFSRIGDVRVNNIARWDGVDWSPLGQGIEWGYVNSLTIYQGDLVAAGRFSFAGGVLARSIARWDGVAWSGFGEGFHDVNTNPREVVCTAGDQDTLVAVVSLFGEYYWGDPSPAAYPYVIDRWTGGGWEELGPGANGPVWSLAFKDGTLFAGGAFDSIGAEPAAGVARWEGGSWTEVGGGIGSPGRSVNSLVVYSGRLVAGGGFTSAGGATASNIATWDGSQWETLGTLPTEAGVLAVEGDTLIAGCVDAIVRWDGQAWSSAAPTLHGRPVGLVPRGDDLFVAGSIEASNPGEEIPTALSVALLSNDTWHSLMDVRAGMRGLTGEGGQQAWVGSLVRYRNRIVAAGSFWYAGAPPSWTKTPDLAEWTGTDWLPFPLPPGLDAVSTLLAQGDTLYAAGTLQGRAGSPSSIYRYDGAHWDPLGELPFHVNAMALYQGGLYAVVDDFSSQPFASSVQRWNGSTWEMIGSADGPYIPLIYALTESEGKLVAAGRFASMGGVAAANIAAWDGHEWQQLGPGLPSPPNDPSAIVRYLTVSDGRLTVAGDQIHGVVRWSGLDWERLGDLAGVVYALGEAGGNLFASGYLHSDDFSSSYSIARWHDDQWEELGSGTNEVAEAFAALGNSVYMGGFFSEAGGKASYAIARWDGPQAPPVAPTLEAARPNPFGAATTFAYSLPRAGTVRLSIHDVTGREIAVLEEGPRSAGPHSVVWSGRDRAGRNAPSGVYFLRAALPDGVRQSRKVILLR